MSGSKTVVRKVGLYWFRDDLRLHDNPALNALCDACDEVVLLYVKQWRDNELNTFGLYDVGEFRHQFIIQSLLDLDRSLADFGQSLYVVEGESVQCIAECISKFNVSYLGVSFHSGLNEQTDVGKIKEMFPELNIISSYGSSLYRQEALPFDVSDMPDVFTKFRKSVEGQARVRELASRPSEIPNAPSNVTAFYKSAQKCFHIDGSSTPFIGGENEAIRHCNEYFSSVAPSSYKQTRNALDDWQASTKFSPWLANGCISAKQIWHQVDLYEQRVEKNDSTYWIKFELLWREFFHWNALKHGKKWFLFSGIQQRTPQTKFEPKKFESWCNGRTGYDIVDACMRQLNETGYMSNRGRQLVASCFVHELALDWRYGAAYFEQQLIDYDVASNWGNWQYLAGVGSDPRGHRQFNLEKQTQMYDPNGEFISRWL